jgi:hypothetical protein
MKLADSLLEQWPVVSIKAPRSEVALFTNHAVQHPPMTIFAVARACDFTTESSKHPVDTTSSPMPQIDSADKLPEATAFVTRSVSIVSKEFIACLKLSPGNSWKGV